MLSCKHTVEQGSDYIEGELSFRRKVEMKMHLMICVHCRRYVKQLRQTISMLANSRYKEPSELQIEELKQAYMERHSR
jgi:predicted anti-sigma-YlaC factor YlaD